MSSPDSTSSNPPQVGVEIIEQKLFATVVAEEIRASINDAIAERGRCSLVLAGGSTPSPIYRVLGRPSKDEAVDWPNVQIYWGDERFVSHDDNQSNYRMADETLLAQMVGKRPKLYPVNTALKSANEAALAYAQTIQQAEGLKAGELPNFDIVLLGVGEDGHTASLFANSPVVTQHGSIAHAVTLPNGEGERVTLSVDSIINARKIIFIVKGENKAFIMRRVLEGDEGIEQLPARLFKQAKGSVTWFLDSSAATKLEKRS